jgi:hypothetical protein
VDSFLYDAMRHVRAAGYVVVDAKRVHEFGVRAAINDAERIYERVDTRALVQRELITKLVADLTERREVLSWRYTQDASVGQVIIDATMLAIEPRWKTGEPQP